MKLLRVSRSEDLVDRYNHTWAVLFLLLLFLVALLSSFNASLQIEGAATKPESQSPGKDHRVKRVNVKHKTATYQAKCWCPSQFTNNNVEYVNSVCAATLNAFVRGDTNETTAPAMLFQLVDETMPLDQEEQEKRILNRKYKDKVNIFESFMKKENEAVETEEENEFEKNLTNFAFYRTPLLIFLLAVFLKVPQFIVGLLNAFSALNVDQIIQTASKAAVLDSSSRKSLHSDLSQAAKEDCQKSGFTTVLFYLLMKILVIAVLIGELIVVNQACSDVTSLQTQSESLNNKEAKVSEIRKGEEDLFSNQDFSDTLMFCAFEIRQLQMVRRHSVQCSFSRLSAPEIEIIDPFSSPSNDKNNFRVIHFLKPLYSVLFYFLLVLLIVDILNIISWFGRLFLSFRTQGNGKSSMDMHFLQIMASLNAGPLVARIFDNLQSSKKSNSGQGDAAELDKLHE